MTPVDSGAPKGTITGHSNPSSGAVTSTISGSGCNDGPMKVVFMPRDMFAFSQ